MAVLLVVNVSADEWELHLLYHTWIKLVAKLPSINLSSLSVPNTTYTWSHDVFYCIVFIATQLTKI